MGNAHHPRLSLVGIAQKNPQSALADAQEQCPPYRQDPLIFGLPQPLDAPLGINNLRLFVNRRKTR